MNFKLVIYLLLSFVVHSLNSVTYSQTNNQRLELAIEDLAKQQEYIDLVNQYAAVDTIKHNVLIFLLENIQYHKHSNYLIKNDYSLRNRVLLADSLYYQIVKGKSISEIKSKPIQDSITVLQMRFKNNPYEIIRDENEYISYRDNPLENLSAKILKEHLEHSFYLRDNNPFIKSLDLKDFCEYIVAYQARFGRYISVSNKILYDILHKYITSNILDIPEYAKIYQTTITNLRNILGDYPLDSKLGFEEVFFKNVPGWDCFDDSNYGTAFMNAVGIPTFSEYNIAYKMLQGKHSSCAILKKIGNYKNFSFGGSSYYPIEKKETYEGYDGWLNIYRASFSPQKSTPFFLKSINEFVPEELSSPFIEDISNIRMRTTSLEIPYDLTTENNLCYLATFNSYGGKKIVTWGIVDKENNTATFNNLLFNRLYFPIYFDAADNMKDFADPFILEKINNDSKNYDKILFDTKKNKTIKEVFITRKFPRKESMIEVAKNLIGTTVIASNESNFKERDTLYTLDFELPPYLQDIQLNISKPYQYYRIESANHSRKMNLSEVQYLTSKSFQYSNSIEPTPLPILKKQDINNINKDLTRILEDSIQKINHWPEYDGKMTTAPNTYPNITLRLKTPQVVTHIRIAPLNADNGIAIGNEYILMEYADGQWINRQQEIATYNYVYSKSLKTNTLYWLRNITKGKEELPFCINDKKEQVFIYK